MKVISRYMTAHWRGQIALMPSLVLNLGLGRFVMMALMARWPGLWPLDMAVLVWQVVGCTRAIRADQLMAFGPMRAWVGYAAVLGATGVFAVDGLNRWAEAAYDVPPQSVVHPQPLPVQNGVIKMSGDMSFELFRRLEVTLARNPKATHLHLTSDGGRIHAARAMANLVLDHGLHTQANGLCASACTLVFAAGDRRALGPDGGLGFHGYALVGLTALTDPREDEGKDADYFVQRGVSSKFVSRIFTTPHDTLWRPDAATLRSSGVLRD